MGSRAQVFCVGLPHTSTCPSFRVARGWVKSLCSFIQGFRVTGHSVKLLGLSSCSSYKETGRAWRVEACG